MRGQSGAGTSVPAPGPGPSSANVLPPSCPTSGWRGDSEVRALSGAQAQSWPASFAPVQSDPEASTPASPWASASPLGATARRLLPLPAAGIGWDGDTGPGERLHGTLSRPGHLAIPPAAPL